MTDSFKPCPFCGSLDLKIVWWADYADGRAVECNTCKGCAPVATWNNRSPMAEVAEIMEEVTL